ncbi:reverse transcriptase domain-containing protein [Tanacetum coccineum]
MTDAAIKVLIAQGVAKALVEYEAHQSSGNGDDSHDSRSSRRTERATRECTYSDFLKCQPLNFKGTEGVVGLTQWFEKMEPVFHISNCTVACQIKFATCTLFRNALTWWNFHVKTVGHDAAYGMPWKTLKKILTNKMFPEESDEVEKYVGGLPDMIQGSVMASKPKTMQDVIEFAKDLMNQKIRAFAERQAENKRKLDNDNQAQQQPPKSPTATNNQRTLTCYECENQGHYRSDCPELKNRNHGNQAGVAEVRRMVYVLGGGETDQHIDNMEDDINT